MSAVHTQFKAFFFGDSICFAQGVSPHKGWVTRISERLDVVGRKLGVDILVQNPSVNGNTTRQALERMAYDVQAHAPDLLLIQFGMNDCNYWVSDQGHPRVSPGVFRANLEEMVRRGRNFGAREVLLLTNHPSGRTTDPLPKVAFSYEESNRRYNTIIRETAAALGADVTLIDIERGFAAPVGSHPDGVKHFLLPDLLHLSEAGNDVYFRIVWPYVENGITVLVPGTAGRTGAGARGQA